jgi:response regulator RpfG family c-di-GMP phosphodiesterase
MTETIMFVDDEENILNSLRRVFRKEPYEVLTCLSAEDALKVLETKEVQVLITDQLMPGMKGTELLQIVKNKYPLMIRIILSGHSDMDDIIRAVNEGEIYRFLKKPDDLTELVQIVERALEQSRVVKKVQEVLHLLQQRSNQTPKYQMRTSYSSGFIKVELNGEMHILSQEQVVSIMNNILENSIASMDLDIIGGVLSRQAGKMTLYADLKSGFQLLLEMPIEKKNG